MGVIEGVLERVCYNLCGKCVRGCDRSTFSHAFRRGRGCTIGKSIDYQAIDGLCDAFAIDEHQVMVHQLDACGAV